MTRNEVIQGLIDYALAYRPMSDVGRADQVEVIRAARALIEQGDDVDSDSLAKALIAIALSPDEDNEWDAVDRYKAVRVIAKNALQWSSTPFNSDGSIK